MELNRVTGLRWQDIVELEQLDNKRLENKYRRRRRRANLRPALKACLLASGAVIGMIEVWRGLR